MTHPDDGTLQAHLDGETRGAEAERLREHLDGCAVCAARLRGMVEEREAVGRAVRVVDVPAPVEAAREGIRGRLAQPRSPRRPGRRALVRAAALLLLVGGVAADRLPGSPVRGWFGEVVGQVRAALVGQPESPAPVTTDARAGEAESGVRVSPVGGDVRIVLTDLPPGSRIDVLLVDGSEAGVRGTGGGRYRTAPGFIEVVGPGSRVRVEIPRDVRSATMEVDGRVYLRKDGGRLEMAGPATDSTEAELRFRTPGGDEAPGLEG